MIGQNSKYLGCIIMICLCYACYDQDQKIDSEELSAVSELPFYHTPDFEPIWDVNRTDTIHKVPPFLLINQNGDIVDNQSFYGKIYVANFFFTNCGGICPKMMRNMSYLQNHTDDKVMFISHSVLPEQDSVSQLKTYAGNFGVEDDRWHLVTGNRTEIYDLARKGYFAEESIGYNKDSSEFLHTEHFMLVDKEGHIRGLYNGTLQLEMDRIIDDIELLQ
ncbi:MAG: SCO family protein [Crocinitomicaceae bacterium]